MKDYPQVRQTKREFIREKRREIRKARNALNELNYGCALIKVFRGLEFKDAVYKMRSAIQEMDDITKPLR